MRNREIIRKKLGQIEGNMKYIKVMCTRPGITVDDITSVVNQTEELISQINDMIEREPISGNEMSPFI